MQLSLRLGASRCDVYPNQQTVFQNSNRSMQDFSHIRNIQVAFDDLIIAAGDGTQHNETSRVVAWLTVYDFLLDFKRY